ncbi:MAG: hypothetical protein OHM57_01835 [Spiroplasma phoeniceum]|nr:MAG: hypothetical protein OHM57_01835 [Spiroplasma phoeniceum]
MKLDKPAPRPTAEAIPPVKTDKTRAKTWIPKNYNNCKPKLFSCCWIDNLVGFF